MATGFPGINKDIPMNATLWNDSYDVLQRFSWAEPPHHLRVLLEITDMHREHTSKGNMTTVLRDEMVRGLLPSSFWEPTRKGAASFTRIDSPEFRYLVGRFDNEGYFIVMTDKGQAGSLDVDAYRQVLAEAKKAGLRPPYHVYARHEIYQSPNVCFNQIPNLAIAENGSEHSHDMIAALAEIERISRGEPYSAITKIRSLVTDLAVEYNLIECRIIEGLAAGYPSVHNSRDMTNMVLDVVTRCVESYLADHLEDMRLGFTLDRLKESKLVFNTGAKLLDDLAKRKAI
jgi:hypothetical protein